MKIIFFLMLMSSFLFASQNDIEGFWKTEKGKAIFHIYREKNEFQGKIVWLDSAYTDIHNPDDKLRGRPILGIISMRKLNYNGSKEKWEKGKIYDSESGKTYSCEVTIADDHKSLYLRGYAGISLIGRTTTWTKVDKDSIDKLINGMPN